jgi:hypothetical protein
MRLFTRNAATRLQRQLKPFKRMSYHDQKIPFSRLARRPHKTKWKTRREETYTALIAVGTFIGGAGTAGAAVFAAGQFYLNLKKEQRERLEKTLKGLVNNLGEREQILLKHLARIKETNEIDFDYMNDVFSDYSSALRYIDSYNREFVPDQIRQEAYFQLQRFQTLREDFKKDYKDDKEQAVRRIRRSIYDMYNVIMLTSRIATMTTTPIKNLRGWEIQLLNDIDNNNITIDEAKSVIARSKVDELDSTYIGKVSIFKQRKQGVPAEMTDVKTVSIKDGTSFDFKSLKPR